MKLTVIGAGVSGLCAAYFAGERAEVTVLEASARAGGVINTARRDGWILEGGPDSLLSVKPAALELVRELGLEGEMVSTGGAGGAFVVRDDQLLELPDGFRLMAPSKILPFLLSPVVSLGGKLRMGLDLFLPRGTDPDPSLSQFVVRRLGREAYERLAQPMVGGIYGSDPDRLSLASTMPEFLKLEQEHGSIIRGMLRTAVKSRGARGARYSLFFNFRSGTRTLVDALMERVGGCVRLESPVDRLRRERDRWLVSTPAGELESDAVVLAMPAPRVCDLLTTLDAGLGALFETIPCSNAVTVNLGFDLAQVTRPARGFGLVVPRVENSYLVACTFSHQKWPGRVPPGKALFRGYLGGYDAPEVVGWPDEELVSTFREELELLLGVQGPPELVEITRHTESMPGYEVGHRRLVEQVEARLREYPGLGIAGNSLYGLGIPDCIKTARACVDGLMQCQLGVGS